MSGAGEPVLLDQLAVETAVEPVPPSLADRSATESAGSPPRPPWRAEEGPSSALSIGKSELGPSASGRASTGKVEPGAASSTLPPPEESRVGPSSSSAVPGELRSESSRGERDGGPSSGELDQSDRSSRPSSSSTAPSASGRRMGESELGPSAGGSPVPSDSLKRAGGRRAETTRVSDWSRAKGQTRRRTNVQASQAAQLGLEGRSVDEKVEEAGTGLLRRL